MIVGFIMTLHRVKQARKRYLTQLDLVSTTIPLFLLVLQQQKVVNGCQIYRWVGAAAWSNKGEERFQCK